MLLFGRVGQMQTALCIHATGTPLTLSHIAQFNSQFDRTVTAQNRAVTLLLAARPIANRHRCRPTSRGLHTGGKRDLLVMEFASLAQLEALIFVMRFYVYHGRAALRQPSARTTDIATAGRSSPLNTRFEPPPMPRTVGAALGSRVSGSMFTY